MTDSSYHWKLVHFLLDIIILRKGDGEGLTEVWVEKLLILYPIMRWNSSRSLNFMTKQQKSLQATQIQILEIRYGKERQFVPQIE